MITIIKMLLEGMARHPAIARHVLAIKRSVFTPEGQLSALAYPSAEPMGREEAEATIPPIPMRKGAEWATEHFGACWFHLTGNVPPEADAKHLVVLMKIQGEGLAYFGEETGDLITSILSVPDVLQPPTVGKCVIDVAQQAKGGDPVDIWVDAGYNGINGNFLFSAKYRYATLAVVDDDLRGFYYDYVTLAVLLATWGHNPLLTQDLRDRLTSALALAYQGFAHGDMPAAKAALQTYYELPAPRDGVLYTLVGHAHLDLAWMWPKRESERKAVRTLTNAVRQIERNPHYVFGMSQAQMLDWVRLSHPALFGRLQQAVAEGRIEVQGGMWVESDCNMPCGESLIRQFAYGDAFFLRYFGVTSAVVWLPDAFGFPYTLPQIIKGVGKRYFATTKLTWNRVNKFPYQSFRWRAPDGSEVLAHISPEGTYCNDGTPLAVAKAGGRNSQPETGAALIVYGVGDGGGGPGEGHVQIADRQSGLAGLPRTRMGSAAAFFEDLDKVDGLPTYDGELYLEYHRGTYTSQALCKQLNRFAERNLHTLEWLLAYYNGQSTSLDDYWRSVLFNQFHDILPGSSIERVHREAVAELKQVVECSHKDAMALLPQEEGFGWLNPSPFARIEYQMRGDRCYLVRAEGYASATFVPMDADTCVTPEEPSIAMENSLENRWVKVVFREGVIASYVDKTTGIEHAKGGLNTLRLYYDKDKKYDAWNIGLDYLQHPKAVRFVSATPSMQGATAVMELRFALPHGSVRQLVRLGYGRQVVFDTYVDWKEEHLMLRADFAPTIYAREAVADIQFGEVRRDTTNDTSVARAQIEVCAHKFVSVADGRGIFALYSDSKYGYRLKEGVLSIDLLRSPKHPDPTCDMGTHHFAYAMDIAQEAMQAVAGGYNFNQPLLPMDTATVIAPLVRVDAANIVVETVKPRAEGEGFAVRLYERLGRDTLCTVRIDKPHGDLYLADMLEHNATPCGDVLHFAPHEIKTLLVKDR